MRKNKKKMFTESLTFLIILLLLLLSLNSIYYNTNLRYYRPNVLDTQLYVNKDNIKIVFFGDCQTQTAINTSYIYRSFNFASPDENYALTYYKLLKLLNDGFDLDIVVLPIDLNAFYYKKAKVWELFEYLPWYWGRYLSYSDIYHMKDDASFTELVSWEIESRFPFIGQGEELVEFWQYTSTERNEKLNKDFVIGFLVLDGRLSSQDTNFVTNKANDFVKNIFDEKSIFNEELFLYFRKTLDLAEKHGLKTVLLKSPITKEYFDASKEYFDIDQYYDKIFNLTDQYNDIYVLDYQDKYFGEYFMFYDVARLNTQGAKVFSEQVNEDFKKLYLTD